MKEIIVQDRSEFPTLIPKELDDAGLAPAEFRVYAHLARRAGVKFRAWPGIDSMSQTCGYHKETIIEAIKTLEKRGMIEVQRQTGKGNVYILTKQSSWVTPKLSTDRSPFPTGRKIPTRPVGKGERKGTQEGTPRPAVGGLDVIHNQTDRIAEIFKRRKSTPWSDKEVSSWKKLTDKGKRPLDDDELTMVERYYVEARKRSDNICRRDLLTFLNHFHGEVDRARGWCEKHPLKSVRKIVHRNDAPILEAALAARPPEMDSAQTKEFCEQFERQFHRLPAGYKRDGKDILFVGSSNGAHT